jgi:hypothetical protein
MYEPHAQNNVAEHLKMIAVDMFIVKFVSYFCLSVVWNLNAVVFVCHFGNMDH